MLQDLNEIFENQLRVNASQLFYLLQDDYQIEVKKHPASELSALPDLLIGYRYTGSEGSIPRFVK